MPLLGKNDKGCLACVLGVGVVLQNLATNSENERKVRLDEQPEGTFVLVFDVPEQQFRIGDEGGVVFGRDCFRSWCIHGRSKVFVGIANLLWIRIAIVRVAMPTMGTPNSGKKSGISGGDAMAVQRHLDRATSGRSATKTQAVYWAVPKTCTARPTSYRQRRMEAAWFASQTYHIGMAARRDMWS